MTHFVPTVDRFKGALLGLAVCDALGAPLEFKRRDTYHHVTGMASGGHFKLEAGTYTDDTAMALCLAESLLESDGHNPDDQMKRYVRWYLEGHMSATGRCIGMGKNTWRALRQFIDTGIHSSHPGGTQADGNGSLMRLAPIALYYANEPDKALEYAALSSRTTHSSELAEACCVLMAWLMVGAMQRLTKSELLHEAYWQGDNIHDEVMLIARGSYKAKSRDEINSSGYVVHTLEAALWAFYHTETFEDGALLAVNLGEDADTVGAVYGQLAGAYYGYSAIPGGWLTRLSNRSEIETFAERLLTERVF